MSNQPGATEDQGHERRVNRILNRAQHEVGLRDFVTLFGARMWSIALAIGAVLYAAVVGVSVKDNRRNRGP